MKKTLKDRIQKAGKLLIAVLTAVSAFAFTPNISTVYAESSGKLTSVYKFEGYFTHASLSALTKGYGGASVMKDDSGNIVADLFCIEPDKLTGVGADYVDTGAAVDPGVAGVIYAFHIDMVQDSSDGLAKYLGAQMAVWAKIRNNRSALDGLVVGEKDPTTAAAAKEYAKKYFDGADAAYAANETAWNDPYKLSSGDFSFTPDSTAVSFVSDTSKTLYFRSDPIHLDLNGDQALLSAILSSVQYTVSLSNDPEGSFIADINGNKRDTFVPAQSFRVYVPVSASAGHSPMTVNVKINNGYTAWTTTSWHSDTHQDLASQRAMAPGEKNLSLAVSFPAAIVNQPKTIYTSALALSKVANQPASTTVDSGITRIVWEKSALSGTRFSLTNTDSFTDSTGKTWAAGEYQTDTYTTDDAPADGNILFFNLPASNDGSPVSWTLNEMTSAPGYAKSDKTLKVKAIAAKCPDEAVGSTAYPECNSTDDYMNGTISKYTKEAYWIENTPIYLDFTFQKTTANGEALRGALFNLFNEDPIKLTNGSVIPAGTLLAQLESDSTGNVSTSNLGYQLPGNVNYYLQEDSAPKGYVVNPETLRVVRRLTGDTQRYDVVNGQNEKVTAFVDEAIPANPEIQTSLKDENGVKTVTPKKNLKLIDTVTYSGLTPGEKYKVSGELMYHKTAEENGTMKAMGSTTFTPREANGTVDVTFIVDSTKMKGGELLTAFETLTKDGDDTVLASHKEISDKDQTVTIEETPAPTPTGTPQPTPSPEKPTLRTTLTGPNNAKKAAAAKAVTLTDTVKYSGLKTDVSYMLSGELHLINEDGTDGGVISTSSRTLNPTSPNGTVNVVFTVDTSTLAGKKTVAFETVKLNEKTVAAHADLTDEDQTVTIEAPKTYTLKVQKMLSGALTGSPEDNGINLAGSPLSFTIYKDGKEVKVLTKDNFKDGYYVAENLDAGVYTVKETANMVSPVTINEFKYSIGQDTEEKQVVLDQNKSVTFTNKTTDITESSIRIVKTDVDNTSKVLEGAEFAIYAANDTNTALATGKTNENGILMFNNLKHGRYVIRELNAPEGYYKRADDINVDLSQSRQDAVTEIRVANTTEGAGIRLVKTDKDSQKPIEGAVYGLYDESGKELTRGTTDSNGVITFFGQYKDGMKVYAKEISAPVGYRLDNEKHEITVDGTKQDLYEVKVQDEAYKVSLEIEKYDTKDTSRKLSGATFELYWKSDTAHKSRVAIVRTDKDGRARIDDLVRGEYVLIETEAPSGYAILEANKEINVDLRTKNDRSVTTVMVNNTKKTEAPSIKTTATINGKKEASVNDSGDLIIQDKVCYTNLEVGRKYTAYASLADADGKTVADVIASGAAVNFTPASKNGCVSVELKINKDKIKTSTNLTVYEQVKLDGTIIARHEEKGNKDQTVTITVPGTPTPTPSSTMKFNAVRSTETGVLGNNIPLSTSLLSSGIALALLLRKKRKG